MDTTAPLSTSDVLVIVTIMVASLVLILAPPLAVWRTLGGPGTGGRVWLRALVALLAPAVVTTLLVVLAWLPGYTGQCGGWLGETEPCRGFGQYAGETLFWAAMSTGMPSLLGFLLGLTALTIQVIRRRGPFRNRRRT